MQHLHSNKLENLFLWLLPAHAFNLSFCVSSDNCFSKGAQLEYGDYYGDSGTNQSYSEYNVSSVLQSSTGSAIAGISESALSVQKIINLREESRVICKNFTNYPKCLDRCLFNVYSDPCETTDLSSAYPKVREGLFNLSILFV